jgi:hypothetical protein
LPSGAKQMLQETRHFIDEVVFQRGGGGRELLTAISRRRASDWRRSTASTGDSVPASDYAVVPRPEGRGIGLLAQSSVLATLAQPNGSSPTKRGIGSTSICSATPCRRYRPTFRS